MIGLFKKKYRDDDFKSLFSVFASETISRTSSEKRRIGFLPLLFKAYLTKINIKITEKQHEYLILADKNVWVLLETNSVFKFAVSKLAEDNNNALARAYFTNCIEGKIIGQQAYDLVNPSFQQGISKLLKEGDISFTDAMLWLDIFEKNSE